MLANALEIVRKYRRIPEEILKNSGRNIEEFLGACLKFRLQATVADNESPYVANTQEYASLIWLATYQRGKPFPQLTKVYCGNTKHTPLNTGGVVVLPSGEECVFIKKVLLAQLQCDATFRKFRKGFPPLATLLRTDHRTTEKHVFVEISRAERGAKRLRTL